MVEGRGGTRLAQEPVERVLVGGRIGGQELQRDVAPQDGVLGAVDQAHAAAAQARSDAVVSDYLPDHAAPTAPACAVVSGPSVTAVTQLRPPGEPLRAPGAGVYT